MSGSSGIGGSKPGVSCCRISVSLFGNTSKVRDSRSLRLFRSRWGIGATAGVFSVIYAALLNRFPYPNADRIVGLSAVAENGRAAAFSRAASFRSRPARFFQNGPRGVREPVILFAGTALLGLVTAVARAIPARHPAEIDPMTALRCD